MEHVVTLAELAESRRLARIAYRRPGQTEASARLVEPYRIVEYGNALFVHGWQVHPMCDRSHWRYFRTYRIEDVVDGGAAFEPRRPVTLTPAVVEAYVQFLVHEGPARIDEYESFLAGAIAEGKCDLEAEQLQEAQRLAAALMPGEQEVIHARLYGQLLMEMAQEEIITGLEEEFLRDAWGMFGRLGWEP